MVKIKATVKRVKALVASVSATRVLVAARRAWVNPWHMAGTEGTGAYKVLAFTSRGRIGVRELDHNLVRIRVEPLCQCVKVAAVLTVKAGWKQPGDGGQNRWSKVVSEEDRDSAIALANKALGVDKLVTARPPAPEPSVQTVTEPTATV